MKWRMLWDLFVHNMSLQFDRTCCHDKSELETCRRYPVSQNRKRKLRSESSFLILLLPTVQFDVVHQHLDLRRKQHTNSCRQHVLNLHVLSFSLLVGFFGFILTLGISASKGSSSSSFPTSTSHQLVRCHHNLVLHLDSELSLDIRAHCSAITVSRLLTVLRKTMISIIHFVGLC